MPDPRDLDVVDFAAAEEFLRAARVARMTGRETEFIAARKMVAVALCIREAPSEEVNVARIKAGR